MTSVVSKWPLLAGLFGIGLLAVAACSPARVLNAIASTGKWRATRDVAYGSLPRQRLDVYAPADARGRPVVVFFYGGGWEAGDRADYTFVGGALADEGFVAVVPDYRVYPEVRFPTFVEDAAAAVAWTQAHIADFGGDPDRIVLMGHSAGAHIATLLAFDRRYLAAAGADRSRLRGVAGLAGPYDFLPLHSETLKAIFGPEAGRAASQPINAVDGSGPPAWLATGDGDRTVDPGNTRRMAARIRARGGRVEEVIYPGVGHAVLIGSFAAPLRSVAPALHDSAQFVRAVTGAGSPRRRQATSAARPEGPQ